MRTHFRLASTSVTATFMTAAKRSHSLRDSAAVTARRMIGGASTSSCPQRRRAHVIHTPCASTSSRSPAISNNGGSRRARVVGFGAFTVANDGSAIERRWMRSQ